MMRTWPSDKESLFLTWKRGGQRNDWIPRMTAKQAAWVSVTAAWKNKSSLLIWQMMKLLMSLMTMRRKRMMMRMKIETVPDCRGKQLLSLLFRQQKGEENKRGKNQ